MVTTVQQFVASLQKHGLLTPAGEAAVQRLSAKYRQNSDASALAKELVQAGALTKFQAAAAYQGKLKELILGNYVLMEKLGEGGMGQVFKARHLRMDRLVAI